VEGKYKYDENYVTVNDVDYESVETGTYGFTITKKERPKLSGYLDYSYDIYPDISFEQDKLHPSNSGLRSTIETFELRRVSSYLSGKASINSIIGSFELGIGAGVSYFDAYSSQVDTSKVEPVFRYEGAYTLFLTDSIYTAAHFTFVEAPSSSYSEFYSLSYRLGYIFK
tara:strand:+ start:10688 stop:11194 length:507 start_codon:yes stop_codon:yes gene_type:complete